MTVASKIVRQNRDPSIQKEEILKTEVSKYIPEIRLPYTKGIISKHAEMGLHKIQKVVYQILKDLHRQ